ncbi:beta-galactosidase [Pseudactinotalea sp.]|uniref:glycoside hydrolase family 35 protein n=1 Tax=Pseudactinotalea sp. TaxID=1926260 RepID=UPI003B3BCAA9
MTEQIISGAIHYARVHPDQWRHRLQMLQAMGADSVETYVPWNLHEPRPGEHTFAGIADLGGFLDLAHDLGLRAIVRPGPYICAEWDNGGLPSWLTGRPGIAIRTRDPHYLAAVDAWFDVLIPVIAARQVTRGGPVSMVQVENEYGSYGSDIVYLEHLRDGLAARGIDVPLFTSDGPEDHMLTGGTIPGVWATVNFGSRGSEAFATLRRHRPDDAPFCMEFWNGWFDHWGAPHHVRSAEDATAALEEILDAGGSVNVYMAHGGTSFGTTAGANNHGAYTPTITSYDYDAPIDEAGRPTPKFWAYREAIARRRPVTHEVPAPYPVLTSGEVTLTRALPLGAVLDGLPVVESGHAPTFEELGLDHGVVRYRAHVRGPRQEYPLTLPGLADRAHVYADGRLLGVLERGAEGGLPLAIPASGVDLEVVVESMGRVNYGPWLGERKGLVGGVLHERQHVHGFASAALPLTTLPELDWAAAGPADSVDGAAFHSGTFAADGPADAFLTLPGWAKGYVWVNGFALGRYWDNGPQRTLYVPAPVLRAGENEIVVLELDARPELPVVAFVDDLDLGESEAAPL